MLKLLKEILVVAVAGAAVFCVAMYLPALRGFSYVAPSSPLADAEAGLASQKKVAHLKTPEPLKAIYMTACVAGTPAWRNSLKELVGRTELNAVVIDIKDFTGVVSFPNNFPKANIGKGCVVADMEDFISELHDSGIYVIGRISVFQDLSYTTLFPELAVKKKSDGGVWRDHKGLAFVDVGAKPYWNYIIELSEASYAIGFDEINYDYIRYPSDGNMQDTNFSWTSASTSKPAMLEEFFAHIHSNMKKTGAVLSADLFGMTTTVVSDMGIGQVLERALPYFDYIAPMVYPSHYPKTWNGFANPAEHPYEVIKLAMQGGIAREKAFNIANGNFSFDANGATTTPKSKLRPWLQDFNLGATYDVAKVRAQIQATYDVGLTSWMLWSAANKYTESALLAE